MCRSNYSVFVFLFLVSSLFVPGKGDDMLSRRQSIRDGESLISADERFELGFFSPNNSSRRYVGIWYHEIQPQTIIWVANRNKSIHDNSGVLKIAEDGNLVLLDGSNQIVWSSNATTRSNDTVAVLLDTGDFILYDPESNPKRDAGRAYWRSFDEPTDTFVPGMRVRVSSKTMTFISWKSENDPSPGNYAMGIDSDGPPQILVWDRRLEKRLWRSGQWDSQIFSGIPDMYSTNNYLHGFQLSLSATNDDRYLIYETTNESEILRFLISREGKEELYRWNWESKSWRLSQSQPSGDCENYNYCGNFGICSSNKARKCSCIDGYEPRAQGEWDRQNWTSGCKRKVEFVCQRNHSSAHGFRKLDSVKLPDFETFVPSGSDSCEQTCLNNCSCNAYAVVQGIGCLIWTTDLIDIQRFQEGGNTVHVKLSDIELGEEGTSKLVIVIPVVLGSILLGIAICILFIIRKKPMEGENNGAVVSELSSCVVSSDISGFVELGTEGNDMKMSELPVFNFNDLASATRNFSENNKQGQGGFGPVYRGTLPGGQEIAVKRLSRKSGQGLEEFKNEISMIAKLQHRNLVQLLGCCIQGEEKLLVYEFMPNKSLDGFIFGNSPQASLDWRKRFEIIKGIARGLLYLHRDSRLRIIHRDLKASNILLDKDMIPKISDFGMARIFGGNQLEANTVRVVGTYGYMAPEYAMEGVFSEKSDVYSFGVLLLEIMSGRRNISFRASEHGSLIGYAWHLWRQGEATALVEEQAKENFVEKEAARCIHIGMLCVQDSPIRRPSMASVVAMLENEAPAAALPTPSHPSFTSLSTSLHSEDVYSLNFVTGSIISGR